jgi:hypothetical protein
MTDDNSGRGWDPVALLALAAVLVLLLAGWWLFPHVQQWLGNLDCVASGRTNCTASGTPL